MLSEALPTECTQDRLPSFKRALHPLVIRRAVTAQTSSPGTAYRSPAAHDTVPVKANKPMNTPFRA